MPKKKKPSMLTSQRQKLAAQRAKRAASQQKARAGMTNLKKPTMQKLVRKAAQKRKAASGRPLVRKSELAKAAKPNIREGAKKLRVPGDSGQVRAAQKRGKAEVRKAVARRGAVAANRRMARKLAVAGAKRVLGAAGKMAGKAALFYEGLKADNTAKGTLEEARKKYGDKAIRPAPAKKAAPKKKAGLSAGAKSFDKAFAAARSAGKKEFTWRGKRYTTKLKK